MTPLKHRQIIKFDERALHKQAFVKNLIDKY